MELKDKNKTLFIASVSLIVIIVVVAISVIVWIWSRTSFETMAKYDFNKDTYMDSVATNYQYDLEKLLKSSNIDSLIEVLDPEYLKEIGFEKAQKDKILKYLKDNWLISTTKSSMKILEYTVAKGSNNVYIYRYKYRINGIEKYVNLIELEPDSYTLSFDQTSIPDVSNIYITKNVENIEFEVSTEATLETIIRYNVKITNNTGTTIKFNFDDVTSVEAILDDDSNVDLVGVVMGSDDYEVANGLYINQTLSFAIPFNRQSSVKKLIFYGVQIGDETKNIEVELSDY